jgi:hypothetical protein
MTEPPKLLEGAYADEEWLDRQVDHLGLDDQGREYLRGRCIAYLRFLEKEARMNLRRYYGLRIPAIVLAAVVPALVAANIGPGWRVVTVIFGITVAAATAVEHFVSAGEKWRHYRQAAEIMKSETWLFVELADRYAAYTTHQKALPTFTSAIETMVRADVRDYVTRVVATENRDGGDGGGRTNAKTGE